MMTATVSGRGEALKAKRTEARTASAAPISIGSFLPTESENAAAGTSVRRAIADGSATSRPMNVPPSAMSDAVMGTSTETIVCVAKRKKIAAKMKYRFRLISRSKRWGNGSRSRRNVPPVSRLECLVIYHRPSDTTRYGGAEGEEEGP